MVPEHQIPPSPDPAGSGTESKIARPFSPTPEPWEFLEDHTGIVVFKMRSLGGERPRNDSIAHFPKLEISFASSISDAEVAANARLFMAAPRVLRLLRALFDANTVEDALPIPQPHADLFYEIEQLFAELEGGAR
jgi:hypothetical protein